MHQNITENPKTSKKYLEIFTKNNIFQFHMKMASLVVLKRTHHEQLTPALMTSKQASIFICPINKHKDIILMNNVQGQAARKAHKAQHCWLPCKKKI